MSHDHGLLLVADIVMHIRKAIRLIEGRIVRTSEKRKRDCYQTLLGNLAHYESSLLAGRLPTPGSGIGFGAGKALSEWGLEDEEVAVAVEAAEALYRDGW